MKKIYILLFLVCGLTVPFSCKHSAGSGGDSDSDSLLVDTVKHVYEYGICVDSLEKEFPNKEEKRGSFYSLERSGDQSVSCLVRADKETGETQYILNFEENVWFNSYRGEEVIVTDEYVLMPIQWVDLEKRVTKDMLNEKQQAILEELLQADMEQNPVLIKYYFK